MVSGFLHRQLPLPEEIHWTPGDSKLHDMSAEEVANQLVVFDWELFSCVHEVSEMAVCNRVTVEFVNADFEILIKLNYFICERKTDLFL